MGPLVFDGNRAARLASSHAERSEGSQPMKHLGCRLACVIPLLLLLSATNLARAEGDIPPGPAVTTEPELARGFHELYAQNFSEARAIFMKWELGHEEDPFGQVAIAASYLFEELY